MMKNEWSESNYIALVTELSTVTPAAYQLEDLPTVLEGYVDAVSYSAIFAVATVANGLAAYTHLATKSLWNGFAWLLCCSFISNFLCSVLAGLLNVQAAWRTDWRFPAWYCRWYVFWTGWTGLTSLNLLAALSALRCRSVLASRSLPTRTAIRCILVIVTVSLAWILPTAIGDSRVVAVRSVSTCDLNWTSTHPGDRAYWLCLLTGQFLLPLGVVCVSYWKIFAHLSRQRRTSTLLQTPNRSTRDRHVAIHIICVISAFLLCWTPYAVGAAIAVISPIEQRSHLHRCLTRAALLCAKSSMAASTVAHFVANAEFRRALMVSPLWNFLGRCCGCRSTVTLVDAAVDAAEENAHADVANANPDAGTADGTADTAYATADPAVNSSDENIEALELAAQAYSEDPTVSASPLRLLVSEL